MDLLFESMDSLSIQDGHHRAQDHQRYLNAVGHLGWDGDHDVLQTSVGNRHQGKADQDIGNGAGVALGGKPLLLRQLV